MRNALSQRHEQKVWRHLSRFSNLWIEDVVSLPPADDFLLTLQQLEESDNDAFLFWNTGHADQLCTSPEQMTV